MEPKSPDSLQYRFEGKPESIKVGDSLKYIKEDGGYFVNQYGFRINTIPVGTRIKTAGFSIVSGFDMPEIEGVIVFKNGETFFNREEKGLNKVHYLELKFFDGDIIKVISLP